MFPAIIAIIGAGTSAIAFPTQYWLWKKYIDVSSQASKLLGDAQAHLDTIRSADVSGGPLFSDGMGNQENADQQAEALAQELQEERDAEAGN